MKIVEKGKNMQVHADFLMLLDTLRISVIMLIAIIHLTFSMTKSNFFFWTWIWSLWYSQMGLKSIYHIFQSVFKLYFKECFVEYQSLTGKLWTTTIPESTQVLKLMSYLMSPSMVTFA